MKRMIAAVVLITALASGCISIRGEGTCVDACPRAEKPPQVLRHVVMFKWKDETSIEQVREIEQAFCALPGKIDSIYDFEWGTNVSDRDLNDGLTHCFIVTFRSEAGLAAYVPHPAHEEFRELIMPHVDKLLVLDYWTKE